MMGRTFMTPRRWKILGLAALVVALKLLGTYYTDGRPAVETTTLQRRADEQRLAANFRALARRIDRGEFASVAEVLKATRQSNNDLLGPRYRAYGDLAERLRARLETLHGRGELQRPGDLAPVWRQIADEIDGNDTTAK